MRKYSELRTKLPPEARAEAKAMANEMRNQIRLDSLREARQITQQQLAEALGVNQANVSRMERRNDVHLSTLRKVVQAMGGQLEIYANFPDGRIAIGELIESLEQQPS